jgi:hypothetical protein
MTTKFVVIAMSKDEARVWNSGIEPNAVVLRLCPPHESAEYRKQREARDGGRFEDRISPEYFESIVYAIADAGEILLVGHGKGKSSWMLLLIQYLERKHPELGRKVVDAVDADLENLSDGEVLALAREWQALNKFNHSNV